MSAILAPPPGFDPDLLRTLATRHDSLQQMWLSGYLYGIALHNHSATTDRGVPESAPAATPQPAAALPAATVLFGSQTGNSKKVAGRLAERLRGRGWEVGVDDLNDYPAKNLKNERIALFVISTQGEGEPPAAAEEFHNWLLGPRAPGLEGVQFAVCGLGDKSYLQFCRTGKEIDQRLEALGASRLTDRADCDADFEDTAERWIDVVVEKLDAQHASTRVLSAAAAHGIPQVNGLKTNGHHKTTATFDRRMPFPAPVLEKIRLDGRGSAKETWHLELSLEGSGLEYEAGDALGIYPENPKSLVQEVLYAAMIDGNKTVRFGDRDERFGQILRCEVELSVLTREVVEKYARWTGNAKLGALLEDEVALKTFLRGRNVADLIREYPAAFSESTLLSFLRKMPPRLYSIASGPAAHPGEAHLTVAAVRYVFNGRPHLGAASTFLADRVDIGATVPVFIERNEYFKLPADDADIIMVGPGTGVAPFRAFVGERAERGARGKNWLFFGNPHFETDFLYQTEWLNHLKRGTLDRLDVAFSRDQEHKVYVQHRLAERSRLVFERLENGAFFYVCGDRERMAGDVQNTVLHIIEKESGRDADYAAEYLKNLKKQRRYLEDVY